MTTRAQVIPMLTWRTVHVRLMPLNLIFVSIHINASEVLGSTRNRDLLLPTLCITHHVLMQPTMLIQLD